MTSQPDGPRPVGGNRGEGELCLKAELEIRQVNEKLDLLLTSQWRRLLEIQRIQMEVMEECVNGKAGTAPPTAGPEQNLVVK